MGYFYFSSDGHTVYVKEGDFFEEQGGLREAWGLEWFRIEAESIEHARLLGEIHVKQIQGLSVSRRIHPVPVRCISKFKEPV